MEQEAGTYSSLQTALANPKAVKVLDLQNKGLTEVPAEIFELPNLESLNLSHNQLSTLPVEIANLPVKELGLAHNHFSEFPRYLCAMRKLEVLNISYNNIRSVPTDLNYLSERLTYLNCKDNLLEEREELRMIRFLPETELIFSLVKSYDPSRPQDRNWTHVDDKTPFNWRQFLSWMAVPVGLILLTLALWAVYKQLNPIPYDAPERVEDVFSSSGSMLLCILCDCFSTELAGLSPVFGGKNAYM